MSFPRLTRILLLLILCAVLGWLGWERLLAAQGIDELDWHGLGLSRDGLALDELQARRNGPDGSRLVVRTQGLFLAWPGSRDGQWGLEEFRARAVQASWQPATAVDTGPSDPQAILDGLRWVPRRVSVEDLSLDLPCASGRCELQGSLQLDASALPATLRLDLLQGERRVAVNAQAGRQAGEWQLDAEATFDGQPWLTLASRLQADTPTPLWSGDLRLAQMADTRPLFAWLSQWLPSDERLLHAEAALRFDADWQLTLARAEDPLDLNRLRQGSGAFAVQAQLKSPQLRHDTLHLQGIDLDARIQGSLADERLALALQAPSRLILAQLRVDQAFTAKTLRAELGGLTITHDPSAGAGLEGPLQLKVGSLQQEQLLPLGWQFKGQVRAAAERQTLRGTLSNDAGLSAELQGDYDRQGALSLSAAFGEIFFRAGNPLSKTLMAWPPLLELANGRLTAKASLRSDPGRPLALQAGLQFKGLDGIYDRSELLGLGGRLDLRLDGQQLVLEAPELNLNQANPGLPIGPLQFQGRYTASLDRPAAGQLSWTRASSGLFKGEASLEPGRVDLAQSGQRLTARLKGLQLDEIFRVYPAEGLAGRGALSGQLPVLVDPKGVRIERGRVAAEAPGYLRFRSQKMRALGRSNPGMQLVVDALDDFHYDLLESAVDYDEHGKLTLGLRLQGRNPDLEKGRPINLNVNLEEDVPALLTSLQLTDKVSETIRQRVQERLRQRNVPAP